MQLYLVLVLCCVALATGQIKPPSSKDSKIAVPDDPKFNAGVGEFPYQISLQVDNATHVCGGAIISKKHILSAAHCVTELIAQKRDLSTITVVVGSNDLAGPGTRMEIDKMAYPPQFSPQNSGVLMYDISIIRLKNEITLSPTVQIIGLPQPNLDIPEDTHMILTGFGANEINGPMSQNLKKVEMHATNAQLCAKEWTYDGDITVTHICASFGTGYGACKGDSGSPLVLDDKSTVVGIVSQGLGYGCGSGYADLYTRVSYYLDFINKELASTD